MATLMPILSLDCCECLIVALSSEVVNWISEVLAIDIVVTGIITRSKLVVTALQLRLEVEIYEWC